MTEPAPDERFLRRAIELALANVDAGDQPFGAVVVVDGEIVGEGVNNIERTGNPTDHAEVNAIRAACLALDVVELANATLYSSAQPCPMCEGAARLVGLARTVYAASAEIVARYGFTLPTAGEFEQRDTDGAEEPFGRWFGGALHE